MKSFTCECCKKKFYLKYYITKLAQKKKRFCSRKCAATTVRSLGSYLLGKKGKDNPRWKGGIYHCGNGYIYLLTPGHPFGSKYGYVKRSRLVMEKHIGRYLLPEERVHHKNKNKLDDNISNLVLYSNESSHQKDGHRGAMASNWKGGKKEKKCKRCGKVFFVYNYRANKAKFCSCNCSNKR